MGPLRLLFLLAAFISIVNGQFDFFGGKQDEPESLIEQFGVREAIGAWSNVLRNVARKSPLAR